MSRYLIEERPLTVLPTLVGALGWGGAAIVQQIHWLCQQPNSGKILDDGEKWVWGTYEEWCELFFTFWEPSALRKQLGKLEEENLVLSCQPNAKDWDRTKHYRVNIEAVEAKVQEYLAKKAEKAHSHRTATNVAHRSGESSSSKRDERSTSMRDERSSSKRDERSTSNCYERSGSYKEQNSLTELSTKPSAASSDWPDPEAHRLLRMKLNNAASVTEGKLEEAMLESPTRALWRTLTLEDVQACVGEADDLYRNHGKSFKTSLMKSLDRRVESKKTPPPKKIEAEEKPMSLEERRRLSEETAQNLPPALRKALNARGTSRES